MASRTTQTLVSFSRPFTLPGFDSPQPPGEYRVDHDEESIEGLSRVAWQRVRTFIHLPGIDQGGATRQMVPIDPADLDAALKKKTNSHDASPP